MNGIRRDHVARYEWAARQLSESCRVLDSACGIGYGTAILARAGHDVLGVDICGETIEYAHRHYSHRLADYRVVDLGDEDIADRLQDLGDIDVAISFETIEHLKNPRPLLRALRARAGLLVASVPNESRFPFRGQVYHHRHYTKAEFAALLRECGWEPREWWGQEGPESEVEKDLNGRTLITVAYPAAAPSSDELDAEEETPTDVEGEGHPEHVVILGLGPSLESYVDLCKRLGGKRRFSDETWGINAVGDIVQCDRIFHMDDVRIQELRAAAAPNSNIAEMLKWLKRHPGPIYTSRTHPDYPGLVAFPLQDVINNGGYAYFNGTAAYAVAYAIYLGVKKISLFGCDFTYANSHHSEKGRACVEFWLGIAAERGIELGVAERSSLMDMCEPQADRCYGYDTLQVDISTEDGPAKVTFTPKETVPTAQDIERRYDHTQHPNPLARK